ncbi:MAG: type III-A CRISPR-associated protein Csm2 [Cyclonatronaceae bacterium]
MSQYGQTRRPNHGGGYSNRDEISLGSKDRENISSIIMDGFRKSGMDLTEQIGLNIKDVTSSQIRIAYGEVTRLKMKEDVPIGEVLLLKPKLAYAAGRATSHKDKYKYLRDVISHAVDVTCDESIDKDEQNKRFKNLAAFFEAILAYHKASGGK